MKRKLMVFGKCPTGKNTGKVLLVLMLGLLCRATLAEAALSLYIDGRPFDEKFLGTGPIDEIDLQLHSDNALPWVGYVVVDDYVRDWPPAGGLLFDPLTMASAGELPPLLSPATRHSKTSLMNHPPPESPNETNAS